MLKLISATQRPFNWFALQMNHGHHWIIAKKEMVLDSGETGPGYTALRIHCVTVTERPASALRLARLFCHVTC